MATLIVASTTSGAGKTALAAGLNALLEKDDEISASGIDVVEGSSGDPAADLKLAEETDALVVLVCGYDDDAPAAAAEYGSRLAGVVINNVPVYRRNEVETQDRAAHRRSGSKADRVAAGRPPAAGADRRPGCGTHGRDRGCLRGEYEPAD